MKKLMVCVIFAGAACLAQNPPEVQTRAEMMMIKHGDEAAVSVAYGGFEMSLDGVVVKNEPFSADVTNEHVQTLADGNHIRNTNTGKIYRDTAGRTRRETTLSLIGPWSTSGQKQTHVLINDPVAAASYDLDQEQKTARRLPSPLAKPAADMKVSAERGIGLSMGPQDVIRLKDKLAGSPGSGNARTENLGTRTIEGVLAEGSRTTITIPAGAMGNEAAIQTVSERWYSPELQMVVLSSIIDPRMGNSTYKLENIVRGEQQPALFEVPADYKTVEGDVFFFNKRTQSPSN